MLGHSARDCTDTETEAKKDVYLQQRDSKKAPGNDKRT
ncbi:hypothetical protein PC123_g12127 [Phytophthora cactorum]|nr:hypothetical protein PC120_g12257 [Phytophthora cactorum]KAG4052698.1 hypothetical protein PC123_g12127 [Phytophthora cactorum]